MTNDAIPFALVAMLIAGICMVITIWIARRAKQEAQEARTEAERVAREEAERVAKKVAEDVVKKMTKEIADLIKMIKTEVQAKEANTGVAKDEDQKTAQEKAGIWPKIVSMIDLFLIKMGMEDE